MNSNDNTLITRWHFAHLTIGYAIVISLAALILMAGDSKLGYSLVSCLSFWAVAAMAVWMACEKPVAIQHRPDCPHHPSNSGVGGGEPSAIYQESHNCGYSKCPHYIYHHPMCPYYRKHFFQ